MECECRGAERTCGAGIVGGGCEAMAILGMEVDGWVHESQSGTDRPATPQKLQ